MKRVFANRRVHVVWFPFGAVAEMPLREWLFSAAHDDEAWFWRVLGVEVFVPRRAW